MQHEFDWWTRKRETLLKLTENQSGPVYVYSQEIIQRQVEKIKTLKSIKQIFYAIKANANPEILQFLHKEGFGFECVSPGELDFVIKLLPDLPRNKILFTPNFAPKEEYAYGFELGVNVNVDNIFPLQKWPEIFKEKEFFLRIDPGTGRGHHDIVKTAGINSKFGISLADIPTALPLLEAIQAKVVGLHAHAGSGILTDTHNWEEVANTLYSLKSVFPALKTLNLGGGFGVVQNPTKDQPLDLGAVCTAIDKFSTSHQDVDLWVEPGRYLVAESGILLAKITQIKHKDNTKRFVGLNAGFNSLIRPILYQSYHHIVNLTRLDQPTVWSVDVVGNICESGDIFGKDREFPESEYDDVILIAVAGAYGRTMSSDYNMRKPPQEVFLKD